MKEEIEKPNKIGEKLVRDKNGKFIKGHPDIGAGRPKDSVSIVTKAKQILKEEPERLEEIARDLLKNPKLRIELIRQIDGMPKQSGELKLEAEIRTPKEVELPKRKEENGKVDSS